MSTNKRLFFNSISKLTSKNIKYKVQLKKIEFRWMQNKYLTIDLNFDQDVLTKVSYNSTERECEITLRKK